MPFVNRFASSVAPPSGRFGMLREHPVIVASSAATIGVLLGGFVAVQLLAPPAKIDASANAPQQAGEKAAPPIAETTGSAPAAETSRDVAAVDCDKQTWPYLSRDCMKNGGTRVIPTDRVDRPTAAAIEAPKQTDAAKPAPVPATAPQPTTIASNPPPATTTASNPPPTPAVAAPSEPPQAVAKADPKPKPKHVAKKAKRKPAKPEQLDQDDDNGTVARDDSEDRASEQRPVRARQEARRWRERRYEVPDEDDGGQRRIVVIRRGGGLFGSLFGGGDFAGDD